MHTIKWQEEYSVGVKELDEQHQSLLNIINKVITELENQYNKEKFFANLDILIHYAYTHFATEESYLKRAQYPDLQCHIKEHIAFIMKTLSLALIVEEKEDNQKVLLKHLNEWFSTHVLGLDRKYIPFLKKSFS